MESFPKPAIQRLGGFTEHAVGVLRLDQLHPVTGGNKFYKLRYNIRAASSSTHRTILTFGGAHSNHIAATAYACMEAGIETIGIIRGEAQPSATLEFAAKCGMRLVFENRAGYLLKADEDYIRNLHARFGDFHLVPEGGLNNEGLKGCTEILPPGADYDFILCACGTGTTYAGLLLSGGNRSVIVGISVLKGENKLPGNVMALLAGQAQLRVAGDEALYEPVIKKHCIISKFAFSGYARFDQETADFKKRFEQQYGFPLDHVYTTKLFYAAERLCADGKIPPRSKVLIIHSGGLQGNAGFEKRYQRKLVR